MYINEGVPTGVSGKMGLLGKALIPSAIFLLFPIGIRIWFLIDFFTVADEKLKFLWAASLVGKTYLFLIIAWIWMRHRMRRWLDPAFLFFTFLFSLLLLMTQGHLYLESKDLRQEDNSEMTHLQFLIDVAASIVYGLCFLGIAAFCLYSVHARAKYPMLTESILQPYKSYEAR